MKGNLLLFAVLSALVWSCSDDENTDQPPPINLKGGITGVVGLEDEFGNALASDSGMKVSVSSIDYAYSDTNGIFLINELAEATYTVVYEKPGCGTFKKFGIPVEPANGNGITQLTGTDVLGQQSTTLITNLSVSLNVSDSTITIACNVGPSPSASQPRSFRLFFGNNASVSSSDYYFTPSSSWSSTTSSGAVLGFQRSILYNAGFAKGSTAWVVAYGESARSNSYSDPSNGKKVFPNLNTASPSNIVQFIVP